MNIEIKSRLKALTAALEALAAVAKKAQRLAADLVTAEQRKAELEALESPTAKQIDELVKLDRAIPFIPPQQHRVRAELEAALETLEGALNPLWPFVTAEINAREAEELERAAQAIQPWCDSLEQARFRAEALPKITRLNHQLRDLETRLQSGQLVDVANEVVSLFDPKAEPIEVVRVEPPQAPPSAQWTPQPTRQAHLAEFP